MTRSVMAFSDMFDACFALSVELGHVLNRKSIPVKLYTDRRSLFDAISKGSRTSERRLMLDIAAAREGFREKAISDIGFFVPRTTSPTDSPSP